MKRIVECARCGIERFAYPSETGPLYCETERCEDTEKQPGDLRQDTNRTAPINSQEEEAVMSHPTPQPAELGTFREMANEVKEESEVDIDGTVCGMDATFRRDHLFTVGEEGERPEYQFGLYNVFDTDGRQIHQQRLVIVEDGHKEVWIDAAPVVLQHIAEWLFRGASELIPGGDDK